MSKPIRFSKTVILEISLKPFKQTDDAYIEQVCENFLMQYRPILKHAKTVGVMFWTSDGSQILDYKGDLDDSFEWCRYIGIAQHLRPADEAEDPNRHNLHRWHYDYMENPPVMTYDVLKRITDTIRKVCARLYPGKKVFIGETFDPGPEFAVSTFKYQRHPEILAGESMGKASMVFCYSTLHADDTAYAAFPDGIKEGTPFATFLGAQSNAYLSDLGFDFLWLSNGMGFGMESWRTEGAVFDGYEFHTEKLQMVKDKIREFWSLLKEAMPDHPILVRGTNLVCGIDYATDGTPIDALYSEEYDIVAPPNSPWASIDGDFGLELAGYMSRIAHLPQKGYMFRYYVHDPWWINSPWYDRYEGQPHDIYLPMSIGRIDENGKVDIPNYFSLLSIDNSFGDLPDSCANEPIPHYLKAYKDAPDAPSPVVWVYPFDEYMNAKDEASLKAMFAQDWFIRDAVNEGLPLSSVVSTKNFTKTVGQGIYAGSVLVTPVPEADSDFEALILDYTAKGGKVIFYGSVTHASERFLKLIGVKLGEAAEGEFTVDLSQIDSFMDGNSPAVIRHEALLSDGGIDTFTTGETEVLASAEQGGVKRAIMTCGKGFVWMRTIVSCYYTREMKMPKKEDGNKYLIAETLMRRALEKFGMHVSFEKPYAGMKTPVVMCARRENGYFFSTYMPDTATALKMKFPLGAPLVLGYETVLEEGKSIYHLPRAAHLECRVFVEQESGHVYSRELTPASYQYRRRIGVGGLKNATVRFFAETECMDKAVVNLNYTKNWYLEDESLDSEIITDENGTYLEVRNVTGELTLYMPFIRE